jgi:hypothetical protein
MSLTPVACAAPGASKLTLVTRRAEPATAQPGAAAVERVGRFAPSRGRS